MDASTRRARASDGFPSGRRSPRRQHGSWGGEAPVDAARVGRERPRPPRREVDQAARDLIRRRGREILATARRYAQTLDDADDAYQRGLEILLRKAPNTREEELVPWLKTVVKHESFALRRQRERHTPITDDGHLGGRPPAPEITHDQVALYERLRQGAEALERLKPQEIRALRLKAQGYSYREICALTGWTYTKVMFSAVPGAGLRERSASTHSATGGTGSSSATPRPRGRTKARPRRRACGAGRRPRAASAAQR
jgi:RNA polymerase sigma factor (sigma-70 family)